MAVFYGIDFRKIEKGIKENMTAPCFFSIVVPVYNTSRYLPRCLDSILNQTVLSWECVLVDDGSTDGSADICDEYVYKDQRFKVIHKRNEGVSVARNIGINQSAGDYIIFVDSDDWVDKSLLEEVLITIKKYKSDIVLFGYSSFDGARIYDTCIPDSEVLHLEEYSVFPEWYNCVWVRAYKRSFLEDNHINFPIGIRLAEDLYFSYLAMSKVKSIHCIQKTLYCYFTNRKDSACNTINFEKIQEEIVSLQKLERDLNLGGRNFTDSLNTRKISAKYKLLFSVKTPQFKLFRETFPEVNHLIAHKNKSFFFYCIFHHFDIIALLILKIKFILLTLTRIPRKIYKLISKENTL